MDREKIERFINVVKSKGKVISTRLSKKYFDKCGYTELWNYFIKETEHLVGLSISQKISLYEQRGSFETPKCIVCGKPSGMYRNVVKQYCSTDCKSVSNLWKQRISNSKMTQDKVESNRKRQETMVSKYGCMYNSQREDIHHIWQRSKVSEVVAEKLNDKEWLYEEYVVKGKTSVAIAKELDCHYTTVLDSCRKYGIEIRRHINRSYIEKEVGEMLRENGIEYESNYTGLYSDGRECDLYLREYDTAIEINGLWWHTERYVENDYHLRKIDETNANVLMITDYQWNNYKEACKDLILKSVGKYERVCADSIEQVEAVTVEIREFYNLNGMDGIDENHSHLILRYGDEILMACQYGNTICNVVERNGVVVENGYRLILEYDGGKVLYRKKEYGKLVDENVEMCDNIGIDYVWTDGNRILSRDEYEGQEGYFRTYDCGKIGYRLR